MSATNRLDVLGVDDAAATRRELRGVLEDEGHTVTEAGDAEKALEMLEANGVPCMFLEFDIQQPVGQFRTRVEAFLETLREGELF